MRLAGGAVKGDGAANTGINIEYGTLIIDSGEINIPRGNAIFANLTINPGATATINGVAFAGTKSNQTVTAYGRAVTVMDSEIFYDNENSDMPGDPTSVSYVASIGATWTIEGVQSDTPAEIDVDMIVKSGGVLNLKDTTLKFKG
ncbi:MAG: hypothetical protein LBL51_05015, partial [Synergistaceae bacterium]|nr:hypothetical protein [Synergistaceae bacterium]